MDRREGKIRWVSLEGLGAGPTLDRRMRRSYSMGIKQSKRWLKCARKAQKGSPSPDDDEDDDDGIDDAGRNDDDDDDSHDDNDYLS